MGLPFQYNQRFLVPVWRRFSDALKLRELESTSNKSHSLPDITDIVSEWKDNKNAITASEIVNAALTTRNFNFSELDEAKTLLDNSLFGKQQTLVLKLLTRATEIDNKSETSHGQNLNENFDLLLEDIQVDNIKDVWKRINSGTIHQSVHHLKKASLSQLSNPIIWIDLSRLYLIQGQNSKAIRAMKIALSLAPDNKFVLRASTSLFVNVNDGEQAIYHLRKSARTKSDPWLVSAHIAASRMINRYSPLIKQGLLLITDKNIAPHSLTELASSIGTEEYGSGGIKKARDFFNIALKRPNDNTLAQIEWISQRDNQFQFNPLRYNHLVHPFEANALDALEKGLWEEAMINGVKWFFETPYNKQSVYFCIFLLDLIFDMYDEAIEFCKAGLRIHPEDPGLINNMVYLKIMANNTNTKGLDKYLTAFSKKDIKSLSNEQRVNYSATIGLVNFRLGYTERGVALYQHAIKLAEDLKQPEIANIAFINLTREIFLADMADKNNYLTKLEDISRTTDSLIIKAAIERTLKKLKAQSPLNLG
ncbi:hypothetical protein LJY25_03555 [Hymenobacter sp. BT175]|uniref:tetratricopeptide repeat protein n=1 Tax=Hymenobacter translucens TaxID=2886507 RepID=UPI001D0E1D2A|nr:hypothetical protein [Hymenobacter translucens]MCC2545507.1 hypothetical protein [Hymenobacter translucens]